MKIHGAAKLLAVLLSAPMAQADETTNPMQSLATGDRVRVEVAGKGKTLRATIESVTTSELVLRPEDTKETVRFDLAQLQSVDVSRGRRSQWRKGAAIGFAPGALLFGLLTGVVTCIDEPDCSFRPGYAVVGGVVGGVITGSVGALIGLAFKTDDWVRVHERRPRVSLMLAPSRGQVRAGLSISF